jgi:NADH:ubiquinone oxidoreductase subunit C
MTINIEEQMAVAVELLSPWKEQTTVEQPADDRLNVTLTSAADLIPMAAALRVKRMGYLSAITGLDHGPQQADGPDGNPRNGQLEVLYHFCTGPLIITLRLPLPREGAVTPTLTELIPSAEPYERELSEMFGIHVQGLRAPQHLYLPDNWPANTYPLRKDFDPSVLTDKVGTGGSS